MNPKKNHLKVWAVLSLLALGIALERLHTYHEPFERDITTYAVAAHELLAGRSLYSDVWDHKPPGIHVTYALAEALVGYGDGTIYFLNLLAGFLTLFGLYRAGRIAGGTAGGLWAGVFWAALSGDLYLEANQPNTEVFLNAFLVWAFVLWAEREWDQWSRVRALAISFLWGAGSFYKPVIFIPMAFFLLVEFPSLRKDEGRVRKGGSRILPLLAFPTAACLFFALCLLDRNLLPEFSRAVFDYNFFVLSLWHWTLSGSLSSLWPSYLWFATPFLALAVSGWFYLRKAHPRPWRLWAIWVPATVLEIFQQGNFFRHYYQLWLPVLCLGAAWSAVGFGEKYGKNSPWRRQTIPALLCLILAVHEGAFYTLPAGQWSRLKYADVFIESKQLAGRIGQWLKPDETFFEWGNETGLYFWTQRRPPSGVFYAYPLADGPLKDELTARVLSQLESTKPELFVFDGGFYGPTADNSVLLNWIKDRYVKLPKDAVQGRFLLLMRKGGELSKRLRKSNKT